MAKPVSPAAAQEKKNGTLRAQYTRQSCLAWMERHKPTVLAKIRELALQKHPKGNNGNSDFVLDESLMNLE